MNHTMLTRPNPIREGFFLSDLQQERCIHTHSCNQPQLHRNCTHKLSQTTPSAIHTNIQTHKLDSHASHTQTPISAPTAVPHTHAANLADSSGAPIADLNRPGDLSLSLTHTQHTFFFHLFPPLSFHYVLFFFYLPKYPSPSPSVTSHQLMPVLLLYYLNRKLLIESLIFTINIQSAYGTFLQHFCRSLHPVFKYVHILSCI